MSVGVRGGCGHIPTAAETESHVTRALPPRLSAPFSSLSPRFSSFSSLSSLASPSSSLPLKAKSNALAAREIEFGPIPGTREVSSSQDSAAPRKILP